MDYGPCIEVMRLANSRNLSAPKHWLTLTSSKQASGESERERNRQTPRETERQTSDG